MQGSMAGDPKCTKNMKIYFTWLTCTRLQMSEVGDMSTFVSRCIREQPPEERPRLASRLQRYCLWLLDRHRDPNFDLSPPEEFPVSVGPQLLSSSQIFPFRLLSSRLLCIAVQSVVSGAKLEFTPVSRIPSHSQRLLLLRFITRYHKYHVQTLYSSLEIPIFRLQSQVVYHP